MSQIWQKNQTIDPRSSVKAKQNKHKQIHIQTYHNKLLKIKGKEKSPKSSQRKMTHYQEENSHGGQREVAP